MSSTATPPAVDSVRHRFIDLGQGVMIHLAEAGPADGAPVMLVHGFPQHWWQWREIMGPLAADGYRVLCPDLRGAGWSTAPTGSYRKTDMADDLAQLVRRLNVGPVAVAAHDWGGPVAFIMMLRHPDQVAGFIGINTAAPWLRADGALLRHLWRFWYQVPIALPVIGPKLIADPKGRFIRRVCSWAGAGFTPEVDVYLRPLRQRAHAIAGSRWYRTFLVREAVAWMTGEFTDSRVKVPVRWLHGTADPVITPTLLRDHPERIGDFDIELVDGAGHWIVEQRPDLVLQRLQAFLQQLHRPCRCEGYSRSRACKQR
ncbi:alpha/beta fold hydrolase [Mycobacterium gastri]|uniref:Epoxide hydrolase n=1 Tax=Mycobacterium gastri TaxID=1777 RepID=A0A1X1W1M3_MYCGS|nr:alpha/beta hydrolase [Mycobacterium gastri]ETW24744.1 epoxide hydrolase [Mycobacterium gastri 'Wayne']ORV80135.1 epoxide hydrolase [Mycobacterium gastri]